MGLKIQSWLLDINQSIGEIFLFIGDRRDFLSYQKDLKTKKAVERNLEIIGEAVSRILKEDSSLQLENSKNIIGTRNRTTHSYDNISDEIIWTIVARDLPSLKLEIAKYLKLV